MSRKKMNPLSRELGDALLLRHRKLCSAMPNSKEDVTKEDVSAAIISYKELLKTIGAPETLAASIGKYLFEVAEWCKDREYPPVNALAVNGGSSKPGAGYYPAPGGNNWEIEVRECIACKRYPPKILEETA